MSTSKRKPPSRLKNVHGRRSRSFGGCVTCRSRRVKCDEGRPECSLCKILGVVCGGYSKDIFFDFDDPSMGVARFRRPLLTDQERKFMSDKILQDVPPNLACRHLSQIDEEGEKSVSDIQISRGPFGVFRITQQVCQESEPELRGPNESDVEHSVVHTIGYSSRDCQIPTELGENVELVIPSTDLETVMVRQGTPSRQGIPRGNDQVLPCDDWLGPLDDLPMIDYTNPRQFNILDSWESIGIDFGLPTPCSLPLFSQFRETQSKSLDIPPQFPSSHLDTISHPVENSVPDDAVLLVKHYSTIVLRGLTPYRHSKTPWHVLFLPHVKSCLAALTLGEKIDHASMCAFYGTLSISAWSLGGMYGSDKWLDQGRVYYEKASFHFRMMLDAAYAIPKKAKYKSTLIALLTMVQLSILSGDKDEAEYYFLETERFIRLRGLNKRKSRKVRLLHHCYVFERLSHESAFTENSLNLDHRNRVRESIEASGAGAYSQDSLSFRLTTWNNLDQDMLKVKGQVEGENDLHLQHPGIWSATLYPEIFGVPELHLFMLSLIIRLSREKDEPASSGLNLQEFMIRAKAVERWIKQLHDLRQSIWTVEAPVDQEQQQSVNLLNSLAETMQHALAVYFYRRIYDLDLGMLEKHVIGVRDRLLEFDASDAGMGYGSLRLIWPAFIAACETDDVSIRGSFVKWFEDSAKRSGLRIFTKTLERIERVWRREYAFVVNICVKLREDVTAMTACRQRRGSVTRSSQQKKSLLTHKIAILGACHDHGAVTAQLLASRGATLSLAGIEEDALVKVKDSLDGSNHIHQVFSARHSHRVNSWIEDTVRVLGKIDGAVNIISVVTDSTAVKDYEDWVWDTMFMINTRGLFNCLRAELNAMSTGASIVSSGSVFAQYDDIGHAAYHATQSAVVELSRVAAKENPHIRVNCVSTGPVNDRYDYLGDIFASTPEKTEKRDVEPMEFARVVALLLSDDASYVTGAVFDGEGRKIR
ncbi:hypothetical protein ACHAPU_000716 [Fusarium lateritium]